MCMSVCLSLVCFSNSRTCYCVCLSLWLPGCTLRGFPSVPSVVFRMSPPGPRMFELCFFSGLFRPICFVFLWCISGQFGATWGAIWGPLGALLGLIFGQSLLRRRGKGPESPPKGPGERPEAENKYSKRGLGGSWPILRRDFSQNAPPRGPQKASKRGPKMVLKPEGRTVENHLFP